MDDSNTKFLTDEFVLSGTLNLRNFVSPIKDKTFTEKHLQKSLSKCISRAGILCSSSPAFQKNRAASTPACSQTKDFNISFGLSNKENEFEVNKKRKFDFLKEIDEVDESVISTQAIVEATTEAFDPKVASNQKEKVVENIPVDNVLEAPKKPVAVEPVVDTSAIVVCNSVEPKIGYERVDVEIKEEEIEQVASEHCADEVLKLSQVVTPRFNLEKMIEEKMAKNNKAKAKINALKETEKKHHRSLPTQEDKTQKVKVTKAKRNSLESLPNPQKADTNELRRSKRVKLDQNEIGVYEFETVTDFQGNQVIVEKLVGTKSRRSLPEIFSATPRTESSQKKVIKSEKIERTVKTSKTGQKSQSQVVKPKETKVRNEKLLIRGHEVSVFSYNQNLTKNRYKPVSEGVTICMDEDEEGGILCIEPLSKCRTQRHTSDVFYVVRQGRCSILINEIEMVLEMGEVAKIPHSVKYKVGNVLQDQNSYVHFQFL